MNDTCYALAFSSIISSHCREAKTGEYEWAREYQYDSNLRDANVNPTYLLQFEEGKCTYLDLNTRLRCTKRARTSQASDPKTEFPRPSKVSHSQSRKPKVSGRLTFVSSYPIRSYRLITCISEEKCSHE